MFITAVCVLFPSTKLRCLKYPNATLCYSQTAKVLREWFVSMIAVAENRFTRTADGCENNT